MYFAKNKSTRNSYFLFIQVYLNFILDTTQLIHQVNPSFLAAHCMRGSLPMLPLPENN